MEKAEGSTKLCSYIQSVRFVRTASDGEHTIALAVLAALAAGVAVAATIGWWSREAHGASLCLAGLLIYVYLFLLVEPAKSRFIKYVCMRTVGGGHCKCAVILNLL